MPSQEHARSEFIVPHLPPGISAALAVIRQSFAATVSHALILGTGWGHLADQISEPISIAYREIPGFPQSSALAHKGELVCGRLHGRTVAVLRGRSHLYEGYSFEQLMFPTRVLAELGARRLIVSNAAGGMNQQFRSGDIMLIADHLNFMFRSPGGNAGHEAVRFAQPRAVYDAAWGQRAQAFARALDIPLRGGIYVGVTGPNYETRAEYRLFRQLGGDAVGMSTLPEVLAAAECGLAVLGFSAITNVAKPDAPEAVNAQEVVDMAEHAAPKLARLLPAILGDDP